MHNKYKTYQIIKCVKHLTHEGPERHVSCLARHYFTSLKFFDPVRVIKKAYQL